MLERLRSVWRKFRKSSHCAVLFVPSKTMEPNDPVETIRFGVSALCEGDPSCIQMPTRQAHLDAALRAGGAQPSPRHIILFAHPSSSWSGFAVNPSSPSENETLLPDWWQISNHRFGYLVAHVCFGARVLAAEPWKQVFPEWLSYNEDIHAFLANDDDIALWVNLGKSIVDAAVHSANVRSLSNRVRAAYLQKMADLMDSLTTRNVVHEMHLQKAMDSLETSGGTT
jgi:hypothetical protein